MGGRWDWRAALARGGGTIEMSVDKMPRVDAFLRCAVPILHLDDEHGSWHGVGGSAFFVRYRRHLFAVTAGHCLRDSDGSNVAVATLVPGPLRWIRMPTIYRTPVLDPSAPYNEATDVAIMVPEREPDPAEVRVLDFNDGAFYVDLTKWKRRGPMAASGFPRTGTMHYDEGGGCRYEPLQYFAIGFYDGPVAWMPACHVFLTQAPAEGPDGISGSPVACCRLEDDGTWTPALAGMVLMGGVDRLHFLDVGRLLGYGGTAAALLDHEMPGA